MKKKSNTAWELCGNVFVIVHNQNNPTDEEYKNTLDAYEKHQGQFDSILIHSEGGGPNSKQRKMTADFWKGKEIPKTVIMTSSVMTRGIVTALSWILPQQRLHAVDKNDFGQAFQILNIENHRQSVLHATIMRLAVDLVYTK